MHRKNILLLSFMVACSSPDQLHETPTKGTITTRGSDPYQDAGVRSDASVDASPNDSSLKEELKDASPPCVQESDSNFCSRLTKECGPVAALDNCSTPRALTSCGSCSDDKVCDFNNNSCCSEETDAHLCSRLTKECGTITDILDNCGYGRTISCGTCNTDSTCNNNKCQVLPVASSPSLTPPGGNYIIAQNLTLASSTPGASIYFTIDGSNPTTASTLFVAPILISQSEVIHAIAVSPGFQNSPIVIGAFTITIPIP